MDTSYPNTQLFINGKWKDADAGETDFGGDDTDGGGGGNIGDWFGERSLLLLFLPMLLLTLPLLLCVLPSSSESSVRATIPMLGTL